MGVFSDWLAGQGVDPSTGASTAGGASRGTAAPTGFGGAASTVFSDFLADKGVAPEGPLNMEGSYRQWYTGQNLEGPNNGWNNEFMAASQEGLRQAYESGNVFDYFAQDDANGVVTWDGAKDSDDKELSFGDIVSNGKKVGNVYDDVDRHTANVMMGEWLITDGREKARLGGDEKAWDERITRFRTENTEQAEIAPRAREYQENIAERAPDESEAAIALAGAGGGALAGAGTGALLGSVVPFFGTAIGAGVGAVAGAVVGGFSSWLNQDSLSYQIARTRETLDIAQREDAAAYTATAQEQIAANVYSVAMSPLSNLVQGAADVFTDGLGNAEEGGGFYATTDTGERVRGMGWQAADLVAKTGDAVLQFASPAMRAVYTAQMGTQISGKAMGLLPGVGQFDEQRLEYDSVWTDRDGNFDAGTALAGVASVGIDVVQLGGMRGLLGGATREAGRVGKELPFRMTFGENYFARAGVHAKVGKRDIGFGLDDAQKAALKEGGSLETLAGYKFVTDAAGNVVGPGRATLSMLAPSEALQSLSAKMMARRDLEVYKGAVKAEDLYNAALNLTTGERRMTMMMVNAFGEAQEEALQGFLDPISHENAVDAEEVMRGAMAGFASGFGMGAATALTRPSQDQRMFNLAQVAHTYNRPGDKPLTEDDWEKMSPLQKQQLVKSLPTLASAQMKAAVEKLTKDRTARVQSRVVGAQKLSDWRQKTMVSAQQLAVPATDQAMTMVRIDEAQFRHDAVSSSHFQLRNDQQRRAEGFASQFSVAEKDLKEALAKADEAPGDPAAQQRVAEVQQRVDTLQRLTEASARITRWVERRVEQIEALRQSGDIAAMNGEIAAFNERLRDFYDMKVDNINGKPLSTQDAVDIAKVISRITTRDPNDSTGSWMSLVPQVDEVFARMGANGVVGISQINLKAIRGDYDGDKVRHLQQLMLDDDQYSALRAGQNKLGAAVMPEIASTESDKFIAQQVMRAESSSAQQIRTLVGDLLTGINLDLRNWYAYPARGRDIIAPERLDRVMDKVKASLLSGGDARAVLLEEMSKEAGAELNAVGRGELPSHDGALLSDERAKLARMFSTHMQDFSAKFTALTPATETAEPDSTVVGRRQYSSEEHARRAKQGATWASTLMTTLSGTNLFRMFQKIHYTKYASTDEYVGWASGRDGYTDAVEGYAQMSRDATVEASREMPANDEIVAGVLKNLHDMSLDPNVLAELPGNLSRQNNMALLANMQVREFEYRRNDQTGQTEAYFTGRWVTQAQLLLKLHLQKYRREKNDVWESDPDVKAPYYALEPLTHPPLSGKDGSKGKGNAEAAFVAVFNWVRLTDILGEDAATLGSTLTVGQAYRSLVDLDPKVRLHEKEKLKLEGAYLPEVKGEQIPYSSDAIEARQITAYRTLVDSIFGAAQSQISKNMRGPKAGKVTGRLADTSDKVSTQIHESHRAVRELFTRLTRKKKITAQDVANLAEQNAEFGRALYDLIPDNIMGFVYKGEDKDGYPQFAQWFFEVFAESNADRAEMIFFRGVTMDSWYSKAQALDVDSISENDTEQKKIAYHSLDNRLHRLMFRMQLDQHGGQLSFNAFLEKMASAKTVGEFMSWLNDQPMMTGGQAPYLAWVNDTADFDATKTGSGWTKTMQRPQIMENLRNLQATAERLVGEIDRDADMVKEDQPYVDAIERYHRHLKGEDVALGSHDEQYYNQFKAAVEQAGKRRMGYGPKALISTISVTLFGLYGKAHTKGANPEHLRAEEMLQVWNTAFAFETNSERLIGDLTSQNESDVAANPALIMRDGGRMQTSDGAQVEWEDQTMDRMVSMLTDVDSRHILRSLMFPQVVELAQGNRAKRELLMGRSIKDLIENTGYKQVYSDSGTPSQRQALKYLSALEMELTDQGQVFNLRQKIFELALAKTTGKGYSLDYSELEGLVLESAVDLATVLQQAGLTRHDDKSKEDPAKTALRMVQEATKLITAAQLIGTDAQLMAMAPDVLEATLKDRVVAEYRPRLDSLQDQFANPNLSPQERQAVKDQLTKQERFRDAELAKIDRLMANDVLAQVIDMYEYVPEIKGESEQAKAARKKAKQKVLTDYVWDNQELLNGAGPAFPTVQLIREWHGERVKNRRQDPLILTDEQLAVLSQVVVSVDIQKLMVVGSSEKPPPPLPPEASAGQFDKRKYMDPSFSWLADFLDGDNGDGLLAAARDMAVKAGKVNAEIGSDQLRDTVVDRFFKKDANYRWSETVPAAAIESYDLMSGASSAPVISMAGKLTERWGAVAHATRRTTREVDQSLESRVSLTWDDLNWADVKNKPAQASRFHEVVVNHPTGAVRRPFHQLNNRFARSLVVTYEDASGATQTIDLMNGPNGEPVWSVARPFAGGAKSDLREVHMDRLLNEIRNRVANKEIPKSALSTLKVDMQFLHPDMQPTEVDKSSPGTSYYNNLWLEGTVFSSDGDTSFSMIAMLIFGVGGINAATQQAALDTRKKGLFGLESYRHPSRKKVRAAEDKHTTDFAQMLLDKTQIVLETPVTGGKPIHEDFYNAVYKLMKLSHWLEGKDADGNLVRWTAEQVIEWQLKNPAQAAAGELPLRDAKLWIPSNEVLADMMGDIGFGGTRNRMVASKGAETDLTTIPLYEGWSDRMQERFAPGREPVDLFATEVSRQSYLSSNVANFDWDARTRSKRQGRVEQMMRVRGQGLEDRRRDHTFDSKKTNDYTRNFAELALANQAVDLDLPPEWAFARMSPAQVADSVNRAIATYISTEALESGGLSASFVYQEQVFGTPSTGLLSKTDLTGRLNVLPGDLVVIDASSFKHLPSQEARDRAMEVLTYFANRNVAVAFVASDGRNDLTAELSYAARERFGYERYRESPQVMIPGLMMQHESSQNLAAAASHLLAIEDLDVADLRTTLLVANMEIEENTLWVPLYDGKSRLDSIQTITDMLPVDVSARFGPPSTLEDAEAVYSMVSGMDVNVLLERALKGANITKKREKREFSEKFLEDWQRMLNRLPDAVEKGETEPQHGDDFGYGDFIPFYDEQTKQVILFRQGFKYPYEDIENQLSLSDGTSEFDQGVALYYEPQPNATTRRGTVDRVEGSQQFGRKLRLNIPVPSIGQKTVVERNGMKYLQTRVPKDVSIPDIALIGDVPLDGIASLHDVLSKEANGNTVTNFRNAFAFFGFDATPVLERYFGSKDKALGFLRALERNPNKLTLDEAYQFQSLIAGDSAYMSLLTSVIPMLDAQGMKNRWNDITADETADAAIVRAMIVYLMTPGAKVKHILKTSGVGIDRVGPGSKTQKMPELFTRAFDMARPDADVKAYFEQDFRSRLNAGPKLTSGPRAGKREGWTIDVNTWKVIGKTKTNQVLEGVLQFGEMTVTDDNPVLSEQAFDRKDKQSSSVHASLMQGFGLGTQVQSASKKLKSLEKVLGKSPIPETGKELWQDLSYIERATAGPGSKWQEMQALEYAYEAKTLERFVAYRQEIDYSGDEWDVDGMRQKIEAAALNLLGEYGLDERHRHIVDYWIRQVMFRPAKMNDQADYDDSFHPPHVLDVINHMIKNAQLGYFPTYDGNGPGFISEPDLGLLYRASIKTKDEEGWAPRLIEGDPDSRVEPTYEQWVAAAFGQGVNSDVSIDPVTLIDLDGMMNTYRSVIRRMGHALDASLDKEVLKRLIDEDTNALAVTMSPINRSQLVDMVLLPATNITIDDLRRGIPTSQDPLARKSADGWKATGRKRTARWRAKNRIRPAERQSTRNMVATGQQVYEQGANMHSLQRIVLALRHGTAMLNPGLYLSMLPEQGLTSLVAQTTNILQGQASSSRLGRVTPTSYSKEQVDRLNNLYRHMGDDGRFTGLIIADLMYQQPTDGSGRLVGLAERYAQFGNRWQDPTWGTTQTALARRYVEAIMRMVESTPIRNSMSVDAVIAHLQTDPLYFQKNHPELHQFASNEVVDYRNLKHTPWSLAARRIYEPWANSSSIGKRFIGTILKMSLMYTTYNANVLTKMAGLQGYNQILSVFLEKRRTPGSIINLAWKTMTGRPVTAEDHKQFDMSSTLDGYTISNAFLKGGVTHTGLFMLGMISANGLGLTGEDDEARRRRRLAAMQEAPLYADPRRLETDFRNQDVLFLDFLPPQLTAFFRIAPGDDAQGPRSGVQISWILKPFLNPIIGMERFFMTGDFSEITNAFVDAAGSLPLFNARTIDDAVRTSEELAALAAEEEEVGTPTATKNSLWFLTSAVAVLERMLFENLFVNSLYTGFDTYDRDPTKMVLRDSDGDIQRTIENLPRDNDQALTQFVDPNTGEVRNAYMKRNPTEATIAAYAENNATFAAAMSLFTGFDRDYWRYNQAVRTQTIKMPEIETDEARALVAMAMKRQWEEDGVQERELSLTEITNFLKGEFASAGDWDSYNNLDAIALQVYESDANPVFDPLSIIKNGKQELTTPGAIAVFKGLEAGTITLDSPEMQGIGISPEVREQIEAEFIADAVQEGMDWGLPRSQAEKRATRLLLGPLDNPTVGGFKEILWDDRIPWNGDATYKQLNTTYVQGPDGYPWATGFKRGGFWSSFGIPKRPTLGMHSGVSSDGRLNTVDEVRGINTGMRGLVPMHDTELIETDIEQTDRIVDAIKDIKAASGGNGYQDQKKSNNNKGRFYKRYGYRRWGSNGRRSYGSSYGSSTPRIYYSRQYTLPRNSNAYGGTLRNIFWDSPTIRRSTIRRERYTTQRGRLNQWQ